MSLKNQTLIFLTLTLSIFISNSWGSVCRSIFLVGEGSVLVKDIDQLKMENPLTALGVGCQILEKGRINVPAARSIKTQLGNWDILTPRDSFNSRDLDLSTYSLFNEGMNPKLNFKTLEQFFPSHEDIFLKDGTFNNNFYKLPKTIQYRTLQSIGYMRLLSEEWNKFIVRSVSQGKLKKCSTLEVELWCRWSDDLEENDQELNERRNDALGSPSMELHKLMSRADPQGIYNPRDYMFVPPALPKGYERFYQKRALKTYPELNCFQKKSIPL